VIGAGAAGLALAHSLRGSGLSVLVIESGPVSEPEAFDRGEVVGLPYNGLLSGRVRGLGGTTAVWPGQCMRLRPEDYDAWPFGEEDLAPWYDRAESLLGLVPGETSRDPWELFGEADLGLDRERIAYATSVFAPRRRMSRLDLGTAQIVTGATVTQLGSGVAEARDLEGRELEIRAERIVVCAGAIESTRLLQVSGLESQALGRFFQDHATCRPARLVAGQARAVQDRFGARFRGGRRYYAKLLLAPEAQRAQRVPGCMANVVFDYPEDSPWEAALRLRRALRAGRPGSLRDARSAAAGVRELGAGAVRRAQGREPAPPPTAVRILTIVEQPPRAESRISLADELDPLGVPRARVDWRLGDEERSAIETLVGILDEEFRRTGIGTLEPEAWLGDRERWTEHVFDSFHPAGTARMAADGVVDSDCRVRAASDLYLCGSAVFPASGCANPTLTIIALALRLADRLRHT
jgi:choline dehydrogenase-like flavoprotein